MDYLFQVLKITNTFQVDMNDVMMLIQMIQKQKE